MPPLLAWGLESALLATLVAAVAWIVEATGRWPRLAHALWALALLRLVMPPLLCLQLAGLPWPAATAPAAAAPAMETYDAIVSFGVIESGATAGAAPLAAPALDAGSIALWLWLAGTVAWLVIGLRRVGSRVFCLRAASPAPAELQEEVQALARDLGLRRAPGLLIAAGRFPPLTLGFPGRSWVLLPGELVQRLTRGELSTVLAHELAHLARGDHLLRWIELVATAIHWWLPTLWIARRHLHELEESCTDAQVLQTLPQRAEEYARALVDTALFLSCAPHARSHLACEISALASLKRRLKMIEEPTVVSRPATPVRLLLVACAALSLLAWPTIAQEVEIPELVEVQPLSAAEATALAASLEQRAATLESKARGASARELSGQLQLLTTEWLRVRGTQVEGVEARVLAAGKRVASIVEQVEADDALLAEWMRLALADVLDDVAAVAVQDLPLDTPLFTISAEIYMVEQGASEKALERAIGRRFDQVTDGFITLTQAQARGLSGAKGLEQLTAPRLTVYESQRASISVVNQVAYVSRFEVEDAEGGGKIIDPIVEVAQDGVFLELKVDADEPRQRMLVELELTFSNVQRPIPEFETRYGKVQRPMVETSKVSALLPMKEGEPTMMGGLQKNGRLVYVVISASRIELDELTPGPK